MSNIPHHLPDNEENWRDLYWILGAGVLLFVGFQLAHPVEQQDRQEDDKQTERKYWLRSKTDPSSLVPKRPGLSLVFALRMVPANWKHKVGHSNHLIRRGEKNGRHISRLPFLS